MCDDHLKRICFDMCQNYVMKFSCNFSLFSDLQSFRCFHFFAIWICYSLKRRIYWKIFFLNGFYSIRLNTHVALSVFIFTIFECKDIVFKKKKHEFYIFHWKKIKCAFTVSKWESLIDYYNPLFGMVIASDAKTS